MATKIEWANETWNPITGCSPISEGCKNCYARRMANRLKGRFGYPEDEPFRITYHPDKIEQPYRWKKSRMIFVCSMGDLFHEDLRRETGFGTSWERVYEIYEIMMKASQHIFIVLTKRPENAKWFYKEWIQGVDEVRNIWLGVTAENQKRADERIPVLLQIPAKVRFVSVEPVLEDIDISEHLETYYRCEGCGTTSKYGGIHSNCYHPDDPPEFCGRYIKQDSLDWVIAGPETGPGKRECKPEWIRKLCEQTHAAGLPFFDKSKKNWIAREFPKARSNGKDNRKC